MTSRRLLPHFLLFLCLIPSSAVALGNEPSERIRRIEATTFPLGWPGSPNEERLTAEQFRQLLKVPAVSVAVIDDYRIVWTKTYGVGDVETRQPVTTKTLFQAGSISKSVTAVGAMKLVEQGKLSLDADINDYLTTWKVPDNEFTKEQKVTLRRLLSHTAGTTIHYFLGYAAGQARPTLVQVLNGEKPANTAPVRVDVVPGSVFRYSGGGTMIVQMAMMDVTRKSFADLMRDAVLRKAGMAESTFEQPLPKDLAGRAVTGYRGDGTAVEGRWLIYPEQAAAGLWTTPTDLANFAIAIIRARQGKSKLLSQKSAELMLTPVKDDAGLGFFLVRDTGQFGHEGQDDGFQAVLVAFPEGKGAVLMSNSDTGTPALYRYLWAIAAEYGMKIQQPKRGFGGTMYYSTLRHGAAAAIAEARNQLAAGNKPFEIEAGALNGTASALARINKRYGDALALLDYNLELFPKGASIYRTRAEVKRDMGRKGDALRDARTAVELDPKNQDALTLVRELEAK